MDKFEYKILSYPNQNLIDRNSLSALYLPIVGTEAFTLYNMLLIEAEITKFVPDFLLSSDRFENILNLSLLNIQAAWKILGACGLVEIKKTRSIEKYNFIIKAPLTYEQFFGVTHDEEQKNTSEHLCRLLLKKLGEEDFNITKSMFKTVVSSSLNTEELYDVTDRLYDVFDIDLSESDENIAGAIKLKVDKSSILIEEKYNELFDLLVSDGNLILQNKKRKYKKLIISSFRNYSLIEVNDLYEILTSMDVKGTVLNEKTLHAEILILENEWTIRTKNTVSNQSDKEADALKSMSEISPLDYATNVGSAKNNMQSVKNMIETLSARHMLKDSLINILISYSISKNDGKIVANYIFKIADTFIKEGIDSLEEAHNFLKTIKGKTKYNSYTKSADNLEEYMPMNVEYNDPLGISDEELQKILEGK